MTHTLCHPESTTPYGGRRISQTLRLRLRVTGKESLRVTEEGRLRMRQAESFKVTQLPCSVILSPPLPFCHSESRKGRRISETQLPYPVMLSGTKHLTECS